MLFNNILYCFSDIYIISYILDFIIGNSITTTFLLYVCSYVFGFCKWHRFIITANIINLLIANVVLKLGITLKQLIEFILDLLLRQYVFLNMLPLLSFVVYILNTKNLLLFFVLFQVILYLLAAIILKCIII